MPSRLCRRMWHSTWRGRHWRLSSPVGAQCTARGASCGTLAASCLSSGAGALTRRLVQDSRGEDVGRPLDVVPPCLVEKSFMWVFSPSVILSVKECEVNLLTHSLSLVVCSFVVHLCFFSCSFISRSEAGTIKLKCQKNSHWVHTWPKNLRRVALFAGNLTAYKFG